MEVHPPEHPIRSVRDFLLHLLTITVGLLIALSLEKTVEHIHNRHLVHEAQTELHTEISENQREIEKNLPFYSCQIAENNNLLDIIHKAGNQRTAGIDFNGITLNRASYAVAGTDGALALMSYSESKSYADVYELQEEFSREQDTTVDAAAPLFGSLFSHAIPIEKMTPSQLEERDVLLESYTGHLSVLRSIGNELDSVYAKALKGN